MALWSVADVLVLRLSVGLSSATYDTMVRKRLWAAEVDPRILLVDIDEASLQRMSAEFGRWPWPRDTLATVLEHIEGQGPAAIVWDILFADPDRLSPGGDAAFDAAAARSRHSHFPVVRLPSANDGASQIRQASLPGLWLQPGRGEATVALIPPVLPGVASSRLGYNNGVPDRDGVIRRFRYVETLPDGGVIQSTAWSAGRTVLASAGSRAGSPPEAPVIDSVPHIIAWRSHPEAYPRVRFADVFEQAEGRGPATPLSFSGRIVIIGSTAPSLHDIHPTPLSPLQPGLETLATVLDNALHERFVHELPRPLQAALAVGLCLALGLWTQFRSLASIEPWLLPLPAILLLIGYLSLHGFPLFLDLQLPAGLALAFIGLLRLWNGMRRDRWCRLPASLHQSSALWPLRGKMAWEGAALDRLIVALERHAPECRIVAVDANVSWPSTLRWPELAVHAAVVGPRAQLQNAQAALMMALARHLDRQGPLMSLEVGTTRVQVAEQACRCWTQDSSWDLSIKMG